MTRISIVAPSAILLSLVLSLPSPVRGQFQPPGGVCTVTGTQSTGYVLTATNNGRDCNWQTTGGASVDNNTIRNAVYIVDTSGGVNSITGTTTNTFPGAYLAGQTVIVKVANQNTAGVQININGLGFVSVTTQAGGALPSGTLVVGGLYLLSYDGTRFQVIGGAATGGATIPSTTSALKGDGAGNALAVTGTGSNCVHTDGTSAACGSGVTSITLAGTAGQVTVTGTCTITTTGTCTFSVPSAFVLPGTINGITLTTSTGTVTLVNAKTFTVNKTLTLDGTDGVTITFPASNATVATLGLTNTFTGRQDATGAASSAPMKTGTTLPGTCTVGDLFFKSDVTAGQNIYECQSTNTFTQQINTAGTATFQNNAGTALPLSQALTVIRLDNGINTGWTFTDHGTGIAGIAPNLLPLVDGTSFLGQLVATAITPPSTPAAGLVSIYADSSTKNLTALADDGTKSVSVIPVACSSQFISSIAADGTATCSGSGAGITGPGTTVVGNVLQWSVTTGLAVGAGLPVTTSGAANAIVETNGAGGIQVVSSSTGTSPPSLTAGTGGADASAEGTVPTVGPASAVDVCYASSVQHGPLCNWNNQGYLPIPQGPASNTSGDLASYSGTNGGKIVDSNVLASNVVTDAGTATTNQLIFGAGTKTIAVGDLTGDTTTSGGKATVTAKVNGIAYSATAAAHSVEVITTANTTATAKVMPDCVDTGGNHINFTQSTDAFSCGTSGGGTGGSAGSTYFTYVNATGTGPNNTGTETSLIGTATTGSKTLPALTMTSGSLLELKVSGQITTPTVPDNLTINMYMGATKVATAVITGTNIASLTTQSFKLNTSLFVLTGGASCALVIQDMTLITATVVTGDLVKFQGTGTTFDCTATQVFDVKAQWAGAQSGESVFGQGVGLYQPGNAPPIAGAGIAVSGQTVSQLVTVTNDTTSARTFSSADLGNIVTRNNSTVPSTDTLPQAGTSGMVSGSVLTIKNTNTAGGIVRITPATSTINGLAQIFILPGQAVHIYNDGSNYTALYEGSPVVCSSSGWTTGNIFSGDGASYSQATGASGSGTASTTITAATETNFGANCTIPANMAGNGAKFRVTMDYITTAPATALTYQVFLSATSTSNHIWSYLTANNFIAVTALGGEFQWLVTVQGAAGAGVIIDAELNSVASQSFAGNKTISGTTTTSSNWTIQPTLKISGSTTGYMVGLRGFTVEWVNQI